MNSITVSSDEFLAMLKECFAAGQAFPLQITGYSMRPLLRNRKDQVFLISQEVRTPEPGDILLYVRENGSCVLHRFIRVLEDGSFLMNGDAQIWTERIRKEQVRAVVLSIQRGRHMISVDSKVYRQYVNLWTAIKPVRYLLFGTEDVIYRIMKKIGLIK